MGKKICDEENKPSEEELNFLKNQKIFDEITKKELSKKIVGEIPARRIIFLCGIGGRLIKNCQVASYNLLVNDEAGAGKDYITSNTLSLLPKKFYVKRTRISPTAFTYWHNSKDEPNWSWDGKTFYMEDISENILNSEVFKVMCSSGSSATIVIEQKAVDIYINGKPVIIITTAKAVPNSELLRRFIIVNLTTTQEQTKAIMKQQGKFMKHGIIPDYNPLISKSLEFLERVSVRIPFADKLFETFPSDNILIRTHFLRFLDFISASAGFHQFQRQKDSEGFILAEKQDYLIAKECFEYLSQNKAMIPLTINQKKIIECFKKFPELNLSSAMTLNNSKMNFVSLPALITNLQILNKYGIVNVTTKQNESRHFEINIYSLNPSFASEKPLKLPSWEEIFGKSLNLSSFFNKFYPHR